MRMNKNLSEYCLETEEGSENEPSIAHRMNIFPSVNPKFFKSLNTESKKFKKKAEKIMSTEIVEPNQRVESFNISPLIAQRRNIKIFSINQNSKNRVRLKEDTKVKKEQKSSSKGDLISLDSFASNGSSPFSLKSLFNTNSSKFEIYEKEFLTYNSRNRIVGRLIPKSPENEEKCIKEINFDFEEKDRGEKRFGGLRGILKRRKHGRKNLNRKKSHKKAQTVRFFNKVLVRIYDPQGKPKHFRRPY